VKFVMVVLDGVKCSLGLLVRLLMIVMIVLFVMICFLVWWGGWCLVGV